MKSNSQFHDRLVYVARVGSRAYGTARQASDLDLRGVFLAPAHDVLGLSPTDTFEGEGEDEVHYSLNHFVRLAAKNTVAAFEMLFVEDEDVMHATEAGLRLRAARSLFPSKRAVATFGGYAFSTGREAVDPRKNSNRDERDRFGYDTKAAAHAVRLYRIGA